MEESHDFLFFIIEDQRFAIPLAYVKKVLQVVEIRTVPQMPPFLHGVINYFGGVLPILNMHHLFAFPTKKIALSDAMIIVRTPNVKLGLLVDEILEVQSVPNEDIDSAQAMIAFNHLVQGVVKQEDGLVLINDVDKFLNADELKELQAVLDANPNPQA